MKKRRVFWPFGNPQSDAWQIDSPAGSLVLRRNHPLVTGLGGCNGWDVWLDGTLLGSIGSRALVELAELARPTLLAAARPACCSRHREFASPDSTPRRRGGARPGAGRPRAGDHVRVKLTTTIDQSTLALIDRKRGRASRGQFIDGLVRAKGGR